MVFPLESVTVWLPSGLVVGVLLAAVGGPYVMVLPLASLMVVDPLAFWVLE